MRGGTGDPSCGVSPLQVTLILGMGPDRPVHLNLFTSRLKSIQAAARVDENLKTSLVVSADIQGPAKDWQVSLDGKVLGTGQSGDKVEYDVDAKLWWPVNEGSQTRYTVQVDLLSSVSCLLDDADSRTARYWIPLRRKSGSAVPNSSKTP